jgi:hypothetical protein
MTSIVAAYPSADANASKLISHDGSLAAGYALDLTDDRGA